MCMVPNEPTVLTSGDSPLLLTPEAMHKIKVFLNSPDAPGRDELLEVYVQMLYRAVEEGNGKLRSLSRRIAMYEKVHGNWRNLVQKVRRVTKHG